MYENQHIETDAQQKLKEKFQKALRRLTETSPIAKHAAANQMLDVIRRVACTENGIEYLYEHSGRLDEAGLFAGTDWENPQILSARLVQSTLESNNPYTVALEIINLLRLLAITEGVYQKPEYSPEQARNYLTQVVAHSLNRVFQSNLSEAERIQGGHLNTAVNSLFQFIVDHIGYHDIIGNLCKEIWRILGQRPVQLNNVKAMITRISITMAEHSDKIGPERVGAGRLVSALYGPTQNSLDDPGIEGFRQRISILDSNSLLNEARGFARAMHDTGLVSDYHAYFMRYLLEQQNFDFLPEALGLSNTGLDSYRCYNELILKIIEEAVHPETAQTVYGLAMILERGILHQPSMPPSLWRQINLNLSPSAVSRIKQVFGTAVPARIILLSGVLQILGQPLGIGQGNNPTCQSARAISMWSLDNPDYLLHLIAQAARSDSIIMHFEGREINSKDITEGFAATAMLDMDPVSTLLVPHLDKVYMQMGRHCVNRGEDPHYWVNPEFHGWWVGRQFVIAVDIATGKLKDYENFLRHFFASYHPIYNGNQPVIHPQPAGLAVTDSAGNFLGWHAITLLRVALDQNGEMRTYFFNPNNDSGQNWGHGVIVSTEGFGERYGESSLPFQQLASRIYIFHDDPLSVPDLNAIPQTEIDAAREMAVQSWAKERII